MPTTQELLKLEDEYGARNYLPLPVVLSKGDGIWVEDLEGNRYLDCLSAYSALNHGHAHPRLLAALQAQAGALSLTSRAFCNDQLGLFCKELAELTGMDRVLPMNTGAEAVETAIKAARRWGYRVKGIAEGRARIVVCEGNFHGRTTTIISFSSEDSYRDGFGPFTPGFDIVPYGDIGALEQAITDETCALLLEPIQGEAGVVVPPEGYLAAARKLCDERKALLIADEIQTGLGRTGTLLCCEHEGVRADAYLLGKALGGGLYPISAVAARSEVLEVFEPGSHGSTFGGNPLGCAVAREALKILVEDRLAERAVELGEYFVERLRAIGSPHVDHVRGKGLLIGVVLKASAGGARRFCEALMTEGLLCKETHENVIRFAPPLVIEKADIDWAMPRIEKVLK